MITKQDYLNRLIKKIKLNNFNFNKEREKLTNLFIDGVLPIESLNNHNKLDTSIFSDLDELEQQVSNNRYITGSYYTNNILIGRIFNEIDCFKKKLLDPAAGTGNFLIYFLLKNQKKFKNKTQFVHYISKYLFFNEIKESSHDIYILRLNFLSLHLFNENLDKNDVLKIKENCTQLDFLTDFNKDIQFDIIVGNPPYLGTKSLGQEYLTKIKKIYGFTDDLYSLFIFKSLVHLNEHGFLSFVTSSTYLTLSSKQKLRDKMSENGIYKIVKNNETHFNIKTKTATFFINKNNKSNIIKIYNENTSGILEKEGSIKKTIGQRFSCFQNEMSDLFHLSQLIYDKYKKNASTTKAYENFIQSEEFNELIHKNEYLPLGLIAYIATGVDFKGNNDKTLYSLNPKNKKYNHIENEKEINFRPLPKDFIHGLSNKKYIPAIKGKEELFVLWTTEHVNYLKNIKAPLRNIRLYGEKPKIYCKTSDYCFKIVNQHTLCINTAGACFIIPIIDISLDEILFQIENNYIKEYIKENINNSLCITPNDLKLIPIKIK